MTDLCQAITEARQTRARIRDRLHQIPLWLPRRVYSRRCERLMAEYRQACVAEFDASAELIREGRWPCP